MIAPPSDGNETTRDVVPLADSPSAGSRINNTKSTDLRADDSQTIPSSIQPVDAEHAPPSLVVHRSQARFRSMIIGAVAIGLTGLGAILYLRANGTTSAVGAELTTTRSGTAVEAIATQKQRPSKPKIQSNQKGRVGEAGRDAGPSPTPLAGPLKRALPSVVQRDKIENPNAAFVAPKDRGYSPHSPDKTSLPGSKAKVFGKNTRRRVRRIEQKQRTRARKSAKVSRRAAAVHEEKAPVRRHVIDDDDNDNKAVRKHVID